MLTCFLLEEKTMARGNTDNLIVPSSEEARKNGSKGGKASGDSRRNKRKLQNALQKLLNSKYKIGREEDGQQELGGYDAIAQSMILEALGGNVKAATFIRDTIGEKPVDVVDFENNDVTGIKISFVNKSNSNKGKEKDPKIVGDYTPPSNTEG